MTRDDRDTGRVLAQRRCRVTNGTLQACRWAVGAAAILAGLALLAGADLRAHPAASSLTWAADVRPILERRCAGCHAAGGVEPLLTDYLAVREQAHRIKRAVLERTMPPWQSVPGFGDFANDRSLTPGEIDLIASWIEGGQGQGQEARVAGSEEGRGHDDRTADLLLDPGHDSAITSARQAYSFEVVLPPDRYIRGWQVFPGNVRHVKAARILADGVVLGTWLPGERSVFFPAGTGVTAERPLSVTLEVDYREPANPASDRSRVALYLGSGAVREIRHIVVERGTTTLRESLDLIEIQPSVMPGQSVRLVAYRPDGSTEALLWTRAQDPDVPATYRLRTPVLLPRGSQLQVWSFDATCSVDLYFARPAIR
jgi:hypothetical protein